MALSASQTAATSTLPTLLERIILATGSNKPSVLLAQGSPSSLVWLPLYLRAIWLVWGQQGRRDQQLLCPYYMLCE
jgi:hypothetical protein